MAEMKTLTELMKEGNPDKMRDRMVYLGAFVAVLEFLFVLFFWWVKNHG